MYQFIRHTVLTVKHIDILNFTGRARGWPYPCVSERCTHRCSLPIV